MADDLQSLIAGTDPTAAQQLQAMNAENQLRIAQNPTNYADQGIFGGLARQMALGQAGAALGGVMPGIVDQKQAAVPGLLRAMASPDPWLELLNDPNAGPVEKSMLAYAPSTATPAAQYGNLTADAAYRQQLAKMQAFELWRRQQFMNNDGTAATGGAPRPGGPGGAPGGFPANFNYRYPGPAAAPAPAPNLVAGGRANPLIANPTFGMPPLAFGG